MSDERKEELFNLLNEDLKRWVNRDRTPILYTGIELANILKDMEKNRNKNIIVKLPFTGI